MIRAARPVAPLIDRIDPRTLTEIIFRIAQGQPQRQPNGASK